jgi:hypothetical protein
MALDTRSAASAEKPTFMLPLPSTSRATLAGAAFSVRRSSRGRRWPPSNTSKSSRLSDGTTLPRPSRTMAAIDTMFTLDRNTAWGCSCSGVWAFGQAGSAVAMAATRRVQDVRMSCLTGLRRGLYLDVERPR